MKPAYTPDNTRSSVLLICSLAAVVVLAAALLGLGNKPQVDAILISANDTSGGTAEAPADPNAEAMSDDQDASSADDTDATQVDGTQVDGTQVDGTQVDGTQVEGAPLDATQAGDDATDSAPEGEGAAPEVTREVIVVPTSEPTATPEIVAAVESAAEQEPEGTDSAGTDSAGEVQPAPSLPTTSGSVQGSFFTRSFENDGAVVAQNLIQLSFSEDGSGAFQGVLDITYADGSHVLLNMSGPLVWLPTNPQVEATLAGAFTLDALIDTDDVMTDDAELSISSLSAGSGSLCTSQCFGFTFPPQ